MTHEHLPPRVEYWYCPDCDRRYKSVAAARACCTYPED